MDGKQKALLCSGVKGTYAVELIDIPQPGPGEVLVELRAVGLNPMDWMMHDFGMFVPSWPAIFGYDGAGVVAKVGEGVTKFGVGDKVMHAGTFEAPRVSTFRQYVAMKADFVAAVPHNLSLDEAATLPLVLATAALGMYDAPRAPHGGIGLTPVWEAGGRGACAGAPIFINAGSTAVGQLMIQFAKLSGFAPIITTASPHNTALLLSLGATHVLDRHSPFSALASSVRGITDKPIMHALDAISTPESQNGTYDLVAPGGRVLIDTRCAIAPEKRATGGKEVAQVFGDVQRAGESACGRALYAHLTGLFEGGDLKPGRVEVVPGGLAGVPDALERLKNGVSALKLVVRPQETP